MGCLCPRLHCLCRRTAKTGCNNEHIRKNGKLHYRGKAGKATHRNEEVRHRHIYSIRPRPAHERIPSRKVEGPQMDFGFQRLGRYGGNNSPQGSPVERFALFHPGRIATCRDGIPLFQGAKHPTYTPGRRLKPGRRGRLLSTTVQSPSPTQRG